MKPAEIELLLPGIFRRVARDGNPIMVALLSAMESMHERPESVLRDLEVFFDPRRAPDPFVPFLGQWVDLARFYEALGRTRRAGAVDREPITPGTGRLRELIAHAAYLSRWRGTARGMRAFLEIATGFIGFEIVENPVDPHGRAREFHFSVRVPSGAEVHAELIGQIIQAEKPAYTTYDVEYAVGEKDVVGVPTSAAGQVELVPPGRGT